MVTQAMVRGKVRNVHLLTEYEDGSYRAKIYVGNGRFRTSVAGVLKTNTLGHKRFYPNSKNSDLL